MKRVGITNILSCVIAIGLLSLSGLTVAALTPTPLTTDARLKITPYSSNQVYPIATHYGVTTDIEFSHDERVIAVYAGKGKKTWQVTPILNHLFVKPLLPDATTNVTVLTNGGDWGTEREYVLVLRADDAAISSQQQVFRVQFTYPRQRQLLAHTKQQLGLPPHVCVGHRYHREYSYTGDPWQAPIQACDDGTFTYLEFHRYVDFPAVFTVNADRTENSVNLRAVGNWLIIKCTALEFTLRHGSHVTNVYNDRRIGDWSQTV